MVSSKLDFTEPIAFLYPIWYYWGQFIAAKAEICPFTPTITKGGLEVATNTNLFVTITLVVSLVGWVVSLPLTLVWYNASPPRVSLKKKRLALGILALCLVVFMALWAYAISQQPAQLHTYGQNGEPR